MGHDDASSEVTVVESRAPSPSTAPRAPRTARRQVHVRAAAAPPAAPIVTGPVFRYRKTPLVLVLIYFITLVVPWILICILAYRPLSASSYYEAHPTKDINSAPYTFARALSTINGVLAIPIISALLGSAAVIYVTRRKANQKLSVAQLFALADRGWASVPLLWPIRWEKRRNHKTSLFLLLGACFVALGTILQPLASILVDMEQIAVVNQVDEPISGMTLGQYPIAADADLGVMEVLNHDLVIQSVLARLATVSDRAEQPNMWLEPLLTHDKWYDYNSHNFKEALDSSRYEPISYFVSALKNGTHTGVLREHAVRLNSSVHCESISVDEFPAVCSGPRPLAVEINRVNVSLAICAPGHREKFPFTLSRNRQDIAEQLYIKAASSYDEYQRDVPKSGLALYCTATTTRGYFELGNAQNNYKYGPLLDWWPDAATIARDFHDDVSMTETAEPAPDNSWEQDGNYPFTPYYPYQASSAGPLMVAAEALFGNFSMLQFLSDTTLNLTSTQALLAMCQHGNPPFSRLTAFTYTNTFLIGDRCRNIAAHLQGTDRYRGADPIYMADTLLLSLMQPFVSNGSEDVAEYLLSIAMYLANEAVLTETVKVAIGDTKRPIYFSPGKLVLKPKIDKISLIVLSVLVGLQVLGLVVLTWYIYSMPTWAPALDAVALARIGKDLDDTVLPPLGPVTKEMEKRLADVDGLVGVMPSSVERGTSGIVGGDEYVDRDGVHVLHTLDANGLETGTRRARVVLGRGGDGLVTKRLARQGG